MFFYIITYGLNLNYQLITGTKFSRLQYFKQKAISKIFKQILFTFFGVVLEKQKM